MKIAIFGVGVVGSALKNYLEETLPSEDNQFLLRDPYRGMQDNLEGADIAFICVPVPTNIDRTQNLTALEECLQQLQKANLFHIPIVIKSTVLPGTSKDLGQKYLLHHLIHMPEFLTERYADVDMHKQDIVCGGRENLTFAQMAAIKSLFPNKRFYFMRSEEAELAKYAHNCFAATKVNFFNIIKEVSDILSLDYEQVKTGFLMSELIEPEHTRVPGPDRHFGYGGKCLPKDLKAFIGFVHGLGKKSYSSLVETEAENYLFRAKKI